MAPSGRMSCTAFRLLCGFNQLGHRLPQPDPQQPVLQVSQPVLQVSQPVLQVGSHDDLPQLDVEQQPEVSRVPSAVDASATCRENDFCFIGSDFLARRLFEFRRWCFRAAVRHAHVPLFPIANLEIRSARSHVRGND